MPFIHVRAYSGRDVEGKQKMAQAMVKAASEASGAPETAFTVVYEDIDREVWEKEAAPILEQLKDKVVIQSGKLV
ncbi:MAG: tautomerase family protein [Clostridiales bacterium]|nr:tautomerase family protein [Clostridiales bacterium]